MTEYFLIPVGYEALLKQKIDLWKTANSKAYVVINAGIYTPLPPHIDIFSTVVNSTIENMAGKLIPLQIEDSQNNRYNLTYFILEGELSSNDKKLALSLNGVEMYNNIDNLYQRFKQ